MANEFVVEICGDSQRSEVQTTQRTTGDLVGLVERLAPFLEDGHVVIITRYGTAESRMAIADPTSG